MNESAFCFFIGPAKSFAEKLRDIARDKVERNKKENLDNQYYTIRKKAEAEAELGGFELKVDIICEEVIGRLESDGLKIRTEEGEYLRYVVSWN